MGKRMDFKAYGKLNVILWEEFSYGKINVIYGKINVLRFKMRQRIFKKLKKTAIVSVRN